MAWSYWRSERLTQAIFFANPDRMPRLVGLLESVMEFVDHPLLVALIYGMTLSTNIERGHKLHKEVILSTEGRILDGPSFLAGQSWWPAEGSCTMLSAMMAGASTKLANLSRKAGVLEDLFGEFIEENLDGGSTQPIPDNRASHSARGGQIILSRSRKHLVINRMAPI
ncbi:hypothetical protein QQS21_009293 [Conoideocrella luteorostrata]|uniref:Uncharacterized protein n=1 Tax=Conoideocrella luteorostrata TaxID=1105319 RepID=A0AAJ0CH68_9HYPO|nr:hypothetical protein QQS21_009293 [Conoideocrella luteorostrata]